ncbi:MAG: acyltransferase [Perlucidibaca sp.]
MRYAIIDCYRLIAAYAVLFYHYAYRGERIGLVPEVDYGPLEVWARYGYLGVPLFFMISGYVISITMQGRSTSEFLKARVIRLFPIFWVCCLLTYLLTSWLGTDYATKTLLLNLTMLPEKFGAPLIDGVYWSLAVELYFYAMVAVLILLAGDKAARWLDVVVAIGLLSVALKLLGGGFGFPIRGHFPLFAVGILLYRYHQTGGWGYLVGSFIALFLATALGLDLAEKLSRTYAEPFNPLVICGLYVAMYIMMFCIKQARFGKRASSLLLIGGGLTYPLYLLHAKIGYGLFLHYGSGWAHLVTMVFVMTLVAGLLFQFVDVPMRRYLASKLRS